MLSGMSAPEFLERPASDKGEGSSERHAPVIALLDLLKTRFGADTFQRRGVSLDGCSRIGNRRLLQLEAADANHPLRWDVPETAFSMPSGRFDPPRFEVLYATRLMTPFEKWRRLVSA